MSRKIGELTDLMRGLRAGTAAPHAGARRGAAESSSGAFSSREVEEADRGIPRTSSHVEVSRQQVQERFEEFLSAHTLLPLAAVRVVGPPACRSLVARYTGSPRRRRTEWTGSLASGGLTRLSFGPDLPHAQIHVEIICKRF